MRQRIARLISNIFNPFLISIITVVLLVLHATTSLSDAFMWSVIALALTVIPVFGFILFLVWRKKLDTIFPEGKDQRKLVYIIASVLAAIGCWVMWRLNAPELLTFTFIAGFVAVVVFMTINLYWKISLHTAFISAAAMVLTLIFGAKAAWLFLLLPLIAWSRLELKLHTLAQVVAGAVLAMAIVTGILLGFGAV